MIIAGYVVLIVLTIAVLSYQVYMIHQLNDINTQLANANVSNVLTSKLLNYHELMIEDNAVKYHGTRYADYLDHLKDYGGELEKDLQSLKQNATSESEIQAIDQVWRTWSAVKETIAADEKLLKKSVDPEATMRLNEQLMMLYNDSQFVVAEAQTAINNTATRSSKVAASASRLSIIARSSGSAEYSRIGADHLVHHFTPEGAGKSDPNGCGRAIRASHARDRHGRVCEPCGRFQYHGPTAR